MSSIDIRWYDEGQNVVVQEYRAEWRWEQLTHAMRTSFALMSHQDKPTALIVDMDHPDSMRRAEVGSFAQFQEIRKMAPPNLHLIIVVGVSTLMQSLARVYILAINSMKVRVEFVETLAHADQLLADFTSSSA